MTTEAAPSHREELLGLLGSANAVVRREAVAALGRSPEELLFASATEPSERRAALTAALPPLSRIASANGAELVATKAEALRCLTNIAEADDVPGVLAADKALISSAIGAAIAPTGRRACAFPGCPGTANADKRCSQCHMAWYCSASCAKLHWNGGHKVICRVAATASKRDVVVAETDIAFLASSLLANIARQPEACAAICSFVPALVDAACALAVGGADSPCPAAAERLSDAVMNVTQDASCRTALMGPANAVGSSPIAKIVRDIVSSPEVAVRRSGLGALRNVCFDVSLHPRLLAAELDVPSVLLGALRGEAVFTQEEMVGMPERLRKPRPLEQDLECRNLCLDGLTQLVCRRPTRAELIVRKEYDMVEKDEIAKDKVAAIADLLIRDSEGDGNLPVSKPIVAPRRLLPPPTSEDSCPQAPAQAPVPTQAPAPATVPQQQPQQQQQQRTKPKAPEPLDDGIEDI